MRKATFAILLLSAVCLPAMAQTDDTHEHSACGHDSINPEKEAIMSEVTVSGLTGTQRMKDSPIAFSVVTPKTLHQGVGTNLMDIIAHQPGMDQITTGAGIAKPVIRGLGYNRVVVVDQGIRQEGQQWGDEHGLEVDGEGIHSVEILKGPASLMYGSDAIAGVMILHPEPVLSPRTMQARVGGGYQSNNGLYDYHVGFAGNLDGWLWNWHFADKSAHAYRNATDGYVPGSWFRERNVQGMLGVGKSWGHSWLRFSSVNFTPGIIEGERDEATGKLLWDDEASAHGRQNVLPFQRVQHNKIVSDNVWYLGDGKLKAIVGYQQNHRREFEESREEASLGMRLHTVNYDIRYETPLNHDWNLSAGINGMGQKNVNQAEEMLIPDYSLLDFGVFATAEKQWNAWRLSGGARVDNRHLDTRETMEGGVLRFSHISKNFTGATGSLGAVYNVNDKTNLRVNLARGFRAPTVSELSSNGVHEGSIQYELGNQNLRSEYSAQMDLGFDYTSHLLSVQASLFSNWISNYIFLSRLPYETDGYRTYQYRQGNARLMGGEVAVDVHPINALHIENAFSVVRGIQLGHCEDKDLPMMPAPRWTGNVRYELPNFAKGHCQRPFVSMGVDYTLRQRHYYGTDETETATPAYALLNVSVGMDLHVFGHNCIELTLCCQNLLDKVYQPHLSRLKYADVNSITGRQGVSAMGRNICLKVNIPIDIHLKKGDE